MLTTPRRITLYWFLLLVPTLVVGGTAVWLLHREQGRLAEQSAEAVEARRANTAARSRLIVENIELLVGDVQEGLLDTLALEPAEGLDAFLDQWEQNNPLVRTAFRSNAAGRVLRPEPRSTSEDAWGFVRRFPRQFGSPPPWAAATPPTNATVFNESQQLKRQQDESDARKEVGANVGQLQSARRDVQELLKSPAYSNSAFNSSNSSSQAIPAAPTTLADATSGRAGTFGGKNAKAEVTYGSSKADVAQRSTAPAAAAPAAATAPGAKAGKAAGSSSFPAVAQAPAKNKLNVVVPGAGGQGQVFRSKDAMPDRRGWTPATIDGRLHLVGWIQPGGVGDVRGVELELAALISRLGGALPAEVSSGEGYALRDDQGRVLHQVGAVPHAGQPSARVPLAAALLPGWDVVGYLSLPPEKSVAGAGFFWVNALLVAIFIAAILAGGSLLLWQARRSEEEAVQKTSFVANVSHEFKTPLTTIRLYAELLEQGRVRDAAQGGDYLRTIGRETQRLARLVNNALDFSRLEQGKKKYARESVDLTAEMARLIDTHAPRLAEAGLKLERTLPTAALNITTDRDALEQIVLNLLDNAVKYAGAGGEVMVTVAPRNGSGAEVRVSDRGPGVPAEHRDRIFEKFHRVDDALTAEKTGAGLGLSIARQLARGLGGELRFAPREGGGAEFILELP